MGLYDEVYKRSIEDPASFWAEAAAGIDWHRKWDKVLGASNPPFYRWFQGAELNTCYNAIDRHVEQGRGGQVALIYDSPVTSTIEKYSYSEMQVLVSTFAGGLRKIGVQKGDTIVIYMPT